MDQENKIKKEQTRKEKTRKKGKEKEAEKHHLLAKWGSQSLILWPVRRPLPPSSLGRFLFYLFVQAAYFAPCPNQAPAGWPAMHLDTSLTTGMCFHPGIFH